MDQIKPSRREIEDIEGRQYIQVNSVIRLDNKDRKEEIQVGYNVQKRLPNNLITIFFIDFLVFLAIDKSYF